MPDRTFTVVLEPDATAGFTAIVPSLPGVVAQGETLEETLANARDAIELCLADLAELGEPLPAGDPEARIERVRIPIAV